MIQVISDVAHWLFVNTPGNLAASAICLFAAFAWSRTKYWPLHLLHRKLDTLVDSHERLHGKLDAHERLHEAHARKLDEISRTLREG